MKERYKTMTMTYHAKEERADRIYIINRFIGTGNPVKEIPATSKKFGGNAKAILTDTGIIIVKDRDIVITMIVPTLKYVKVNFYPETVIPWEMQMTLSRNKKYIEVIETLEAR
jgi:hypothetical protein